LINGRCSVRVLFKQWIILNFIVVGVEDQITDEKKEAPILDEVSRNSLIGVFAVLGLIMFVCFVCGVTILCFYRI
jgi:hypothetical protein